MNWKTRQYYTTSDRTNKEVTQVRNTSTDEI